LDKNGFKRSESGFDTNKTNPFLSISIHFRLLGKEAIKEQINKTFQNSWLKDIFIRWLALHSELSKTVCTAYNASIACRETDLLRHSQTVKYIYIYIYIYILVKWIEMKILIHLNKILVEKIAFTSFQSYVMD